MHSTRIMVLHIDEFKTPSLVFHYWFHTKCRISLLTTEKNSLQLTYVSTLFEVPASNNLMFLLQTAINFYNTASIKLLLSCETLFISMSKMSAVESHVLSPMIHSTRDGVTLTSEQ